MKIEKILVVILLLSALAGIVWSIDDFFTANRSALWPKNTPVNYQQALQSELPDKCQTPPGYTNESWRDHMSHHPDRYSGCLSGKK